MHKRHNENVLVCFQIYIVAFEEDLHKRIKSVLQELISYEAEHKIKGEALFYVI